MSEVISALEASNARRFKPYPAYKPSGVQWLGSVPEHWTPTPLKRAISSLEGPGIMAADFADRGSPLIRIAGLGGRNVSLEGCDHLDPDLVQRRWSHFRVRPGDLLISGSASMGLCSEVDETTAGAIPYTGIIIMRPRPGSVLNEFVRWFFVSDQFLTQAHLARTGSTIQHFGPSHLASMSILLPPPTEQHAISGFLQIETTKIDTLVRKKAALIEKLKEKRSALISRTVTRGLPPDAARAAGLEPNPPLKPTGVSWLGDVPAHWDVKQLKWAITFQRGHDLPSDQREEGNVPLVTSSGESATHSVAVAKGPGIVTGRYGTIGEFYLVEKDYWPLNTTLYSIDLRGNEPRFLRRMLTNLSPLFLLNAVKSAVPGVDRNDIHPVICAVPPVSEQHLIADFLDRETTKIDRMTTKVEVAIQRLQEYRTALITGAVTGKIDVRKKANDN
jgi:type I restriction enzyme, S subunit